MFTNKYFLLFCLFIVINSCTKELPVPDADDKPLMVVNSLISPDSTFLVSLSESCHIQKANCDFKGVNDAQVEIKDANGTLLTTLNNEGNGIYGQNNFSLEKNTTYQIEINHSSLSQGALKGQTNLPKEFTSTLMGVEEVIMERRVVWAFDIEIEDNPDEENFYVLEGYFEILDGEHDFDGDEETNGYFEPHFSHYSNDINAENNTLTSGFDYIVYPLKNVYLPDKNFNGQTYRTQFGVRDWDLLNGEFEDIKAHVFVKSVSKEMYEYLKSLELYSLSNGNIFAEPVQIYSNIDNGLGIFGGYKQKAFTVDLPPSEYLFPRNVSTENEGCTGPCAIKFSTDGGSKLTYQWDFGDGTTSTEPNPEHTYSTSGTYDVKLGVSTTASTNWGATFTVLVN